jgi:hypothetical protein
MPVRLRPLVSAALSTVVLSALPACVTPSPAPSDKEPGTLPRPPDDKVGTKVEPGTPAAPDGTPTAQTPPPGTPQPGGETEGQRTITEAPAPTAAEMVKFVRTQSSPNAGFGAGEHELVAALPSQPEPGSIEEAALALGLVKTVLHPLQGSVATFREDDLGGTSSGDRTVRQRAVTLEQLCKERGVDLADALTENPLLAGHGIARQALEAVRLPGTTPDFRAEVLVALGNQVAFWKQIAQELGGGVEAQPGEAAPAPFSAPPPPPEAGVATDAPPPNPADLRGGDSTLGEAQTLADRGAFQAAIKRAASVDPNSPMFPMAQEKIREFSNLGVQELRRKAAQAFQSAMPLVDRQKRAEYLQQAKGYLEQAIDSYPQASQLPTVRDNLRSISKDLDKLQAELKGG